MMKDLSRRKFLEKVGVGTAAGVGYSLLGEWAEARAENPNALPTRTLGRTGAKVSILAFGCGSRFLMYEDEAEALAILNHAIDNGITYLDTAYAYGDGKSETRVGKVMAQRRKEVWLATKIPDRTRDEFLRRLEASLKRLQTDHVDLLHIHALLTEEDLAAIEAKGGVLEQIQKMRDQKMTRFIGITCHFDPSVLKMALERHDFDCTQMALNGALVGMEASRMVPNKGLKTSFETVALPVANRKQMGVIAMKVFAQEALLGGAPPEKLLTYTLSLPVTAAVVGMPKLEHIEDNVRVAKAFKPMPKEEMERMSGGLSRQYKASLDRFFSTHVDA